MMYRNAALLKLANGAPCMAQIPGVCRGRNETVVAAHSNALEHGKGVGLKSHDAFVCFACQDCHDAIDGRTQRLEKEDRRHYWQRGFERTLLWMWQNDHLKVKL